MLGQVRRVRQLTAKGSGPAGTIGRNATGNNQAHAPGRALTQIGRPSRPGSIIVVVVLLLVRSSGL
jgi:hypothetical protein